MSEPNDAGHDDRRICPDSGPERCTVENCDWPFCLAGGGSAAAAQNAAGNPVPHPLGREAITIVSGFGRCGSSLVMQMLDAGGMPCAGEYPAFEPEQSRAHLAGGAVSAEWLASIAGHAVKILDPQNGTMPKVECRIIWCARDYHEQARSHVKFGAVFGLPADRALVRSYEKSYRRDKPLAVRSLLRTGAPSIAEVRFEDVLREPERWAHFINEYCGGGLDESLMAKAVRPRSPLCAPDMSMELTLIRERNAA